MAVVLAAGWARTTSACSCSQMLSPGRFYPNEGGMLPLDAPGIPWTGPGHLPELRVTLRRVEGAQRITIMHRIVDRGGFWFIAPRSGLKAGETYVVTVRERERYARALEKLKREYPEAPDPEITATFTVSDRPLHLTQATLRATAPVKKVVQTHWGGTGGGCGGSIKAVVTDVAVELPPEVEPLRDYLLFETLKDGAPWTPREMLCREAWRGRSWQPGVGTDRVLVDCDSRWPERPRIHRVEVRVRSPDGAHTVVTNTVELTLDCSLAEEPMRTVEATALAPPPLATRRAPGAAPVPAEEAPPRVTRGCAMDGAGGGGLLWFGWLWMRRRPRTAR